MTAMTGPGLHPVSRAVSTMRDQVGEVTEAPMWSMGPAEAGIIPMVLGGEWEVLDLGRGERFHKPHQRLAVGVRDKICTAQGCDWPPWMCHVHHDTPFSQGGPTSVDDARLLCPRHHARAHDPTYETTRLPGGKVAFHRRT
jgi:hypothetical protein